MAAGITDRGQRGARCGRRPEQRGPPHNKARCRGCGKRASGHYPCNREYGYSIAASCAIRWSKFSRRLFNAIFKFYTALIHYYKRHQSTFKRIAENCKWRHWHEIAQSEAQGKKLRAQGEFLKTLTSIQREMIIQLLKQEKEHAIRIGNDQTALIQSSQMLTRSSLRAVHALAQAARFNHNARTG